MNKMKDELKSLKAEFFDCDMSIAQLQQKKQELIQRINNLLTEQKPIKKEEDD